MVVRQQVFLGHHIPTYGGSQAHFAFKVVVVMLSTRSFGDDFGTTRGLRLICVSKNEDGMLNLA